MASNTGNELAVRFPSNTERDPATGRPVSQYGKIKEATSIATSGAAAKARMVQMTTNQVSMAVHDLWKEYERKVLQKKEALTNNKKSKSVPDGLNDAQHAQEVFVLLASLGERLLALDVFDQAMYTPALEDVKSSLAAVNIPVLREQFDVLTPQQQYPVAAALVFCTFFYPMHVYRGYGACVLEDWDWGCPDVDALFKEKVKQQGSWLSRLGQDAPVAQPNQKILEGFDRVIMLLQSRSSCKDFLVKKPAISGLVSTHVRLEPRPKKDVKKDLELLEDFTKEIKKRGHPGPKGVAITAWSLPFATWRSMYSCSMTQEWENSIIQQQDPGRILHAYLNKEVLSLPDGHIVVLPPGTLAEALACWMEGLPGTRHRTLRWHNLDTVDFAVKMKKASKSVYRKLGQYPLPNTFVVAGETVQRQPSFTLVREATSQMPPAQPSPVIINKGGDTEETQAPPPYARSHHSGNESASAPARPREGTDNEPASALSSPQSWTTSPVSPNPIRRKPMPSREDTRSSDFGVFNEKASCLENSMAASSSSLKQPVGDRKLAPDLPPRAPSPLATGNYLDLLNEVAQGRITPQQLSQMLKEQQAASAATSQNLRAEGLRGSKAVAELPPQNDMGEFQEPWNVSIGPPGMFEMPTERDPVETDGIAKGPPRSELPNNEIRNEDETEITHQEETLGGSGGAEPHSRVPTAQVTHANATHPDSESTATTNNANGVDVDKVSDIRSGPLAPGELSGTPIPDDKSSPAEDKS